MGFLFKQQSNLSLGISISNTLISIIQIRQNASGIFLEAYGVKELTKNSINDNKIVDTESMGQIIGELISSLDVKTQPAITNVSQGEVITKIIQLPIELSDAEIDAQIRIDADQYIPYPLAEVSFDFEILGESIVDSTFQDVLLVIAQTDCVDLRVDSLAFANIDTQVVEVDIHAIERAYQFITNQGNLNNSYLNNSYLNQGNMNNSYLNTDQSYSSHSFSIQSDLHHSSLVNLKPSNSPDSMDSIEASLTIVLVDIGNTRSTVYIAKQNEFVFQSEKLFGSCLLTDSIQSSYALDEKDANQAKINWGVDNSDTPSDYMALCVEPFIDSLIDHILSTFESYQFNNNESKISKPTQTTAIKNIMLCGGGACLSGIEDMLGSKMSILVDIANPFKHMNINPRIDSVQLFKIAPRLMTTFGLSIREFSELNTPNKQKI